jgi:putative ATP-binding cassette transporter
VNLEATRGQCVLISGPSGCGKTSLFRICAGLRSLDAERLVLPERQHLLFIPQRPYLPIGNLRFQALLLLKGQDNINDKDLYQLFRAVNLQYLFERYTLDTVSSNRSYYLITPHIHFLQVVNWPTVLSVGEQQRLSFIRLLAFFTLTPNNDQIIRETLVLFDESTSAVDAKTEHEIYTHLIRLRVWFVTISHRPSLVHLHTKSLQFSLNKDQPSIEQVHIEPQMSTKSSFENNDENQPLNDEINWSNIKLSEVNVILFLLRLTDLYLPLRLIFSTRF